MRVIKPSVKLCWSNLVGIEDNRDSVMKVSTVSYGKSIKMDKLKFLRGLCRDEEHSPFEHTNFSVIFDLVEEPLSDGLFIIMRDCSLCDVYVDLRDRIWWGGGSEGLHDQKKIEISGNLRDFLHFYLDLFCKLDLSQEVRRLVFLVGEFLREFFGGGVIPVMDPWEDSDAHTIVGEILEKHGVNPYTKKSLGKHWFIRPGWSSRQKGLVENQRVMMSIVCSRAISHQLIRHRSFSFMERSMQRCFLNGREYRFVISDGEMLEVGGLGSVESSVQNYQSLVRGGKKKGEARKVLPIGTSTELYMTGRVKDWKRFVHIRTETKSKSQMEMVDIASHVKDILVEYDLIGGVRNS